MVYPYIPNISSIHTFVAANFNPFAEEQLFYCWILMVFTSNQLLVSILLGIIVITEIEQFNPKPTTIYSSQPTFCKYPKLGSIHILNNCCQKYLGNKFFNFYLPINRVGRVNLVDCWGRICDGCVRRRWAPRFDLHQFNRPFKTAEGVLLSILWEGLWKRRIGGCRSPDPAQLVAVGVGIIGIWWLSASP